MKLFFLQTLSLTIHSTVFLYQWVFSQNILAVFCEVTGVAKNLTQTRVLFVKLLFEVKYMMR